LPLLLFGLTLILLIFAYRPKELPALLLLPPLALLAAPGALSLRRGAANAFDWFSMMTFTFFVGLVWVGWSALALGWPERLAKRTIVLRPGFVGHFEPVAVAIAILGTLWWVWLMVTSPRSSYRSLIHWTMGFTTFWLLATLLWLPWFDYGKSYRPVALAIAKQLPAKHGCLAERDLSDTHRASLAYFTGIEPLPLAGDAGRQCDWLLVQGDSRRELAAPDGNWSLAWEGSRPGDRKERFRLYRR
jgi:4-amino-4-deoxy-L-arabinose transferase-like glycosyltransferase